MSATDPHPNERDALAAALRRDAARIEEEPFEAALHQATMRRLRALKPGAAQAGGWWKPALAGAAVLGAIVWAGIHWNPANPPRMAKEGTAREADLAALLASTEAAAARLPAEESSALPAWMSPTSSLLDLDLSNLTKRSSQPQL